MDTKKVIIFSVVGVLIVALAYWFLKRAKANKDKLEEAPEVEMAGFEDPAIFTSPARTDEFPLHIGSEGVRVERLQNYLASMCRRRGVAVEFEAGERGKYTTKVDALVKQLGTDRITAEYYAQNRIDSFTQAPQKY